MKTLNLLIMVFAFISSVNGQPSAAAEEFNSCDESQILSFNAKYNSGITYLNFLIEENEGDAFYIVEASEDNKNFHPVEVKKGSPSPNGLPLLYSVQDKSEKNRYYRVRRISSNNSVMESDIITAEGKPFSVANR